MIIPLVSVVVFRVGAAGIQLINGGEREEKIEPCKLFIFSINYGHDYIYLYYYLLY